MNPPVVIEKDRHHPSGRPTMVIARPPEETHFHPALMDGRRKTNSYRNAYSIPHLHRPSSRNPLSVNTSKIQVEGSGIARRPLTEKIPV